ncbi:hypothetical protein RDI58_010776 [Solanum bulbocastanum]|uniref:Uncharacterized protein n=1 Tax=Solanum bulbocastanum TaxID=147425 RepID=A0AAN8YGB1_SOLBU
MVDNPRGRTITPDFGIPHTLASMKLRCWLPCESSHSTVLTMVEEDHLKSDLDEEMPDETHTRKLTFSVGSHNTPNSQVDQRTTAEVVRGNNKFKMLYYKHVCVDRMTAEIERVSFARVLIETDITQQLPQEHYIEKPDGTLITQAIKYEWTP